MPRGLVGTARLRDVAVEVARRDIQTSHLHLARPVYDFTGFPQVGIREAEGLVYLRSKISPS